MDKQFLAGDDYHNLPNEFPYDAYEENSSQKKSVDGGMAMAPPLVWSLKTQSMLNHLHCSSMKQHQLLHIHKKLQWREKINPNGKSYWPIKKDQNGVQIKKNVGTGVYLPPNPPKRYANGPGKKPPPPPKLSPSIFSGGVATIMEASKEEEEEERLKFFNLLPWEWTYW